MNKPAAGNYLMVAIADEGWHKGEEMYNIFDPYYSTKEHASGMGSP